MSYPECQSWSPGFCFFPSGMSSKLFSYLAFYISRPIQSSQAQKISIGGASEYTIIIRKEGFNLFFQSLHGILPQKKKMVWLNPCLVSVCTEITPGTAKDHWIPQPQSWDHCAAVSIAIYNLYSLRLCIAVFPWWRKLLSLQSQDHRETHGTKSCWWMDRRFRRQWGNSTGAGDSKSPSSHTDKSKSIQRRIPPALYKSLSTLPCW